MRTRISFVAGLAAGYVLGAKAGRDRYEQIRRVSEKVRGNSTVQKASAAAVGYASEAGGKAVHAIGDHAHVPDRLQGLTKRLPGRHENNGQAARIGHQDGPGPKYTGGL
jgi:hypothetical protein